MKILGLSSNYHDASAALVIEGKVVAAAAEERFSLQKHDPSFPHQAARYCLEEAGLKADELDLVAYHENPEVKFTRTLTTSFVNFPFSLKTFIKSMHESITGGFWIKNEISKSLNIHPGKIVYVPHHLSHAAHAYLTSPFSESAILSIDAVGEWTCTGLFFGKSGAKGTSISPLQLIQFPNSLGLVYSAFTAFLGFKVNDGECSTMALAAFGKPSYADSVREALQIRPDGTYEVDLSFFDFSRWDGVPVTPKFISRFGLPRPYKHKLPFDCMGDSMDVDQDSQRFADIAASIQLVLEECVISLSRQIRQLTRCSNLCLVGGVALNCVANGRVVDEKIFDNIYVPPDPGDAGGAMGAALYSSLVARSGREFYPVFSPYFGKSYVEVPVTKMIKHLKPKSWTRYRQKDLSKTHSSLRTEEFSDLDALAHRVTDALLAGKIVGWFQERFENGPRALGNRSILCDPSNINTARRLSIMVKDRASFRPYGCSVTTEDAPLILEGDLPLPSKWMQISRKVTQSALPKIRAAVHIDRTTRPQVCSKSDNPRFYRLLQIYGQKTGLGALLNTSFNEKGFPLVSSQVDALLMFARTDLDLLVLDKILIEKES